MPEPSSIQRLLRERALNRYIAALEKGDLDALAGVMRRAEKDALLEAMIFELHESYQTDEEFLAMIQEEQHMEIEGGIHKSRPREEASEQGAGPSPEPDYMPAPRSRRPALWVQALAAILLLACLVGSVLLYARFQRNSQTAAQPAHYNLCLSAPAPASNPSLSTELDGVAAISPDNVWAVGSEQSNTSDFGRSSAVIEHWDGKIWRIVPGADADALSHTVAGAISIRSSTFASIAAISADDIWAVGSMHTEGKSAVVLHPLIEHWDGKKWQAAAISDPTNQGGILQAVQAVSSNDIWAVGYTFPPVSVPVEVIPLVEHWDGHRWSQVPTPPSFQGTALHAVGAVSPDDIWIAGFTSISGTEGPRLAHWNGKSWSLSTLPDALAGGPGDLSALKAISANDVWAVGGLASGTLNDRLAVPLVIMHWDGHQWSAMPGASGDSLQGIAGSSSHDVWAVGATITDQALVEHWDGQHWSIIPQPQHHTAILNSVSIAGSKVWAVGNIEELNDGQITVTGAFIESTC